MKNYFQIEKTEDGIFISEGKGTDSPDGYDSTKDWHPWEKISNDGWG